MPAAVIDTNLLVRISTFDTPALARRAEAIIDAMDDGAIAVPLYVVAELVYVLAYNPAYRYDRQVIGRVLTEVVINTSQFAVDRPLVARAAQLFVRTKLDFADCLLAAQQFVHGQRVLTFDKALLKELNR